MILFLLFIIHLVLLPVQSYSFLPSNIENRISLQSRTKLYYTYFPFKKDDDEKKDLGRLMKNILFPGYAQLHIILVYNYLSNDNFMMIIIVTYFLEFIETTKTQKK